MPHILSRSALLAGGAILLVLLACSGGRDSGWVVLNPESKGAGNTMTIIGVVRHSELEGWHGVAPTGWVCIKPAASSSCSGFAAASLEL